jgi:glycosyltransferase involved in cell wall biosynthesis
MNVVLVAPHFPPHYDGVGDHAYAVANALADAGHRVHVLTAGGKTHSGPFRLTSLGETWNPLATLRGCWFLARSREDLLLLEYTPFLFGVASPAPIAFAWLARLLRIPSVVIAHEIFHDASTAALSSAGKRYFAARDTAVLLAADRIAAPSEQRRDRILANLPRVADRIELVPIAANCEPPSAYVRAPEVSGSFEVLAFGVVMKRRRFELAIDALAVARESIDAHLTIVGRIADKEYARQCRDHAIARGVGRNVTFTGGVEPGEVTQRMARAGASIFTAREGCTGSSGSLLALLAHEVPIVAARTDHDDARFASVVAQVDANPQALGEQIVAFARDRDAAGELGKRGAVLYRSDFDWSAVGRGLVNGAAGGARASVALA